MLNKTFSPAGQSALDARFEAQKIAFGPVVFQCVRYALQKGLLQALADAGAQGRSVDELAEEGKWTAYAIRLVLETCLSAGVVYLEDGRFVLDKTGFCLLTDPVSRINFNFVNDICYQGLFELDASIDQEKPLGLTHLGDWPTIYQGLSQLPEPARDSWFKFDNYYSDTSFPDILPDVFAGHPRRIMDIGTNTGKFSLAALGYDPEVSLHLVDLPGQLALTEHTLAQAGLLERAQLYPIDILDAGAAFPGDMDVVWMSQFLSCFSETVIRSILVRALAALRGGGRVIILDTLWDRQKHDIAAYCLINTSPYFTALASGNSKVYQSADYVRLAEQAGLRLIDIRDGIGYCHSLLRFEKA